MGYIIKLSSYCKPEVQSWRHNNRCKFYTKPVFWQQSDTVCPIFLQDIHLDPRDTAEGFIKNERTPRGNLLKPLAINMKSAHYSIRPATAGDVDFYWQMADVSDHLTASMQQYIAGTKGSTGDLKKRKGCKVNRGISGGKYIFCTFLSTHTVF